MAVSYIGVSNLIATNGAVPGAITPNAGTADGDLLVFFHYSRAVTGDETVTLPTGFTNVFNAIVAGRGLVRVGYRIRQTGDTTHTATITNHTSSTTGETVLEWIETYRGADSASPIVHATAALSNWASSLNLGPIVAPATTTVNDGDMVVVFGGRFENVATQTLLTGDGLTWTARTRNDTTQGTDAGAVTQNGLNASGVDQTVTNKTITTTGTAQVGAGIMFIIEAQLSSTFDDSLSIAGSTLTTFGQNASINVSFGAEVISAIDLQRTLDAQNNLALQANSLISESAQADLNAQASFAAQSNIVLARTLDINTSLVFTSQSDFQEIGGKNAEALITLLAQGNITVQQQRDILMALQLLATAGVSFAANIVMNSTLALNTQSQITELNNLVINAGVQLTSQSTLSESGQSLVEKLIILAAQSNMTAQRVSNLFATMAMPITAQQSQAIVFDIQKGISLAASTGVSFDGQVPIVGEYNESITLSALAVISLEGVLALKKIVGIAVLKNIGRITWG